MDIDKELEEIWDDPLLDISEQQAKLFDFPADMRKVMEARNKADYVAQRKLCEDFELFRDLFVQVHQDLKNGRRSLARLSKTANIEVGNFFIVSGQMLMLESMEQLRWMPNLRKMDGRTRCIYENGTESDILLQTLRKNVMADGYVVTETEAEIESKFFKQHDVIEEDKVTGYVYVLQSLSHDATISEQKN